MFALLFGALGVVVAIFAVLFFLRQSSDKEGDPVPISEVVSPPPPFPPPPMVLLDLERDQDIKVRPISLSVFLG